MRKVILSICLLGFLESFAQNDPQAQQSLLDLGSLNSGSSNVVVISESDKNFDITGSPFFIEEFVEGSVRVSEESDQISGIKLRYNVYTKTLEVIQKGLTIKLFNDNVYSFEFSHNDSFYFFINTSKLFTENQLEVPYLRKIATNKEVTLVEVLTKSRTVRDATEPYAASKNEVIYTNNIDYYFLQNGELFPISNKRKLMEKYTALDNNKMLKSLSLKSEDDLVSILKMLE